MKSEVKILFSWIATLVGIRMLISLAPPDSLPWISLVNIALQVLLFILSLWIVRYSYGNQKFVYFNFSLVFGFVFLLLVNPFIKTILFKKFPYAQIYYYTYFDQFGLNVVLFLAITYAVIDDVRSSWQTWKKYIVAFSIVAVVILPLFYPYIADPMRLYSEPEYVLLLKIEKSINESLPDNNRKPMNGELFKKQFSSVQTVQTVAEKTVDDSHPSPSAKELIPFLSDAGKSAIFWKPLYFLSIYVKICLLVFIVIFLWSIYRSDKPHAAYIDKVMILFIAYCILEIFHAYSFSTSSSSESLDAVIQIGQFFTILCWLMMVSAFSLRLRFLLMGAGRHYEKTLQESPGSITRWRDEIDTLILKTFFKKTVISRRIGHLSDPITNDNKKGKITP